MIICVHVFQVVRAVVGFPICHFYQPRSHSISQEVKARIHITIKYVCSYYVFRNWGMTTVWVPKPIWPSRKCTKEKILLSTLIVPFWVNHSGSLIPKGWRESQNPYSSDLWAFPFPLEIALGPFDKGWVKYLGYWVLDSLSFKGFQICEIAYVWEWGEEVGGNLYYFQNLASTRGIEHLS